MASLLTTTFPSTATGWRHSDLSFPHLLTQVAAWKKCGRGRKDAILDSVTEGNLEGDLTSLGLRFLLLIMVSYMTPLYHVKLQVHDQTAKREP